MTKVEIRLLKSPAECHGLAALFASIWASPGGGSPISGEVMIALAGSGNYVAGVVSPTGELIGGAAAWIGRDGETTFVHSHIAGVAASARGDGVGLALKQHQREWALAAGITQIRWTFDPLVRANAWFNLVRLGAVGVRYLEDYYGPMEDALNAGEPTDRMLILWDLETAPRAPAEGGAYPVLNHDRDGEPLPIDPAGDVLGVWLPEDIIALRRSDPDLAHRWRMAQRRVLSAAFADGLLATSVHPDGWLVLSH